MANAEQGNKGERGGAAEGGSRLFRNLHAAGALALAGAGIVLPPLAPVLETAAAFEVVHAGAWEAARRHFAKRSKKQR